MAVSSQSDYEENETGRGDMKTRGQLGSTLQQPRGMIQQYADQALSRSTTLVPLLKYGSVIKLAEYLRHRNPDSHRTFAEYMGYLRTILKACGGITPDDLVCRAKEMDEDQLEALFLDLDDRWLENLNSTGTRTVKWAVLKTFLVASGVKKAKLIECNIRNRKKVVDYALTREDCKRILDEAKTTQDKLTVALLIESLQRIGTICQLTWGDVNSHLSRGENVFMIWIDPSRTKRNIGHWAPIGPLSSYYLRKRRTELGEAAGDDTTIRMESEAATAQRIHRIMMRADIVGKKQGQGHMTRYEKHIHSFRKFGVVQMQRAGVNEQVIRFLMGQKRDTYTEWSDRYDELLKIYVESRPRLDQKAALDDILDYVKSRGYSLDPKDLHRIGEIGTDPDPHTINPDSVAEA